MSLYTPVFPSLSGSDASRKGPSGNTAVIASGRQQSYVEFLRDIHLFLSTQGDMLSPPSRPGSPMFDRRVQKVKDEVLSVFNAAEGDTSSGKWTRISQTLKLGCVRGRHWSLSEAAPNAPAEDAKWILPDEESEWIEWEMKREKSRRLKGKTNAQQPATDVSVAPGPLKTTHASLSRRYDAARERLPRDVSPTTLHAAKEKVRKWQASMAPEEWHNTTNGSSPVSTRAVVAITTTENKAEKPLRSRTLDFAVVKPAGKSITVKKGKSLLSRPGVPGGSAPLPSRKSKASTPSDPVDAPESGARIHETRSEQFPRVSLIRDDVPRIADVPETPYLPPSFPTHLETSTPLPNSRTVICAKPSPILPIPALSSTPLPATSADPPEERQFIVAEPHAANVSSCLPPQPPQVDIGQPGKRSRASPTSLHRIPNDSRVTPPAKRLRSLSQNRSPPSSKHSNRVSPNGALNIVPRTRDGTRDPSPGSYHMGTFGMATGAPSTPGKSDQPLAGADVRSLAEKLPSPAKSVKSYFSTPDSDVSDSPVKANLLLESPVSPMLSYAQNPSGFLPQFASTQVGKGSPSAGLTNNEIGYSSQFDVEKHVDRVSELLEKDVDFDGWLRDARTVDTSRD